MFSTLQFIAFALLISISIISCHAASEGSLSTIKLHALSDKASFDALKDQAVAYKLIDSKVSFDLKLGSMNDIISGISGDTLDFGVGTEGWSESRAAGSPDIINFPLYLHGTTPVYRLDSVSVPIIFTREILVKMYTGEIRTWNHPDLVSVNPLIELPSLNITITIDAASSPRHFLLKDALTRFNSTAMSLTNMKLDNSMDFPVNKYSAYALNRGTGISSLATLLLTYEGAFTMALQSIASTLGLQTGKMVNKAGKVVEYSHDSLTFNAIELGMKPRISSTGIHILNDPTSESAWPMAIYSYAAISLSRSSSTCRARRSLAEFLVNFYVNPVATSILSSRQISPIPSLILKEQRVMEILQKELMCRGSPALPSAVIKDRSVYVSEDYLFGMKLLTSVYSPDEGTTVFEPELGLDRLMLQQVVTSEVDLAIVTPAYINPVEWKEFMETDDYIAVPMLAAAVSLVLNPMIGEDLTIDTSKHKMIVDLPTLIGLFNGCIDNYQDPRLHRTNPWLKSLIGNNSYPITRTVGCGAYPERMPMTTFILTAINGMIYTPGITEMIDEEMWKCINKNNDSEKWSTCKDDEHFRFTDTESLAPLLAMGIAGGLSFSIADSDTEKIFPLVQFPGTEVNMLPTVEGVLACAMDTFSPSTLSFDLASSEHLSCWRTAQLVVGLVRKRYYSSATNSSSCARGLDTLRFVSWFFTARATDTLTDSFNHVQLSRVPGVIEYVLQALNGVLCDDETLLITLPQIWDLDTSLFGVVLTLSIIGIVWTFVLICCVIYYHSHPIMRAASPWFVLLSLVGILMLFGGAIAFVSPVSGASCSALLWLFNSGVMITFTPIVAKVYRLHRIFGGVKLSVVKISNRKLMGMVGIVYLIEIVFMSIWSSVSPIQPVLSVIFEGSPAREWHYTQCATADSTGDAFLAAAATMLGLLLIAATLMAFRTRGVTGAFNETKQIALSIYMTLFTLGVIVAIVMVIEAKGDMLIGLLCAAVIWITFFTASILVLPKILHIRSSTQEQQQQNHSLNPSNKRSETQFSFLSADVLDSLPMIGSYIVALKKHLEIVEHKQQTLKRHNNQVLIAK